MLLSLREGSFADAQTETDALAQKRIPELRAKIVAMATTRLLRSSGIQRREACVHVGGETKTRTCFVFTVRRVLCRCDEFPQGARRAAFQLLSSPCEATQTVVAGFSQRQFV